MLQCLTEIVGVTTSDCECIVGGLTTEVREQLAKSTSGLYMDNLEGGVHLKALKFVDSCRDMAKMALTARDEAIRRTGDDLTIAVNNQYKKEKKNFVGQIGRMSYAASLGVSAPVQALKITPIDASDAILKITRIQLVLNNTATIALRLYRSLYGDDRFLLGEWSATIPGNAYSEIPIVAPLNLPLRVDGQPAVYYFTYEIPAGVNPKDTIIRCQSCGGGVAAYAEYIDVKGAQMTTDLKVVTSDMYSHGLVLDADLRCDDATLFCRQYDEDSAIATAMSYAVRYKAGELLIEDVLKQPDISRYTTMSREYLWGKRNHFRAEYDARIVWMAAKIDLSDSNCYVCRAVENQPFFTQILS